MDESYSIGFKCRNCGETGTLEVPKGTRVEDMPCPNCGCKTLELYNVAPRTVDINENFQDSEEVNTMEE
jgi:hypothetical protein